MTEHPHIATADETDRMVQRLLREAGFSGDDDPRLKWTESDYLADDIRKLREEIGARVDQHPTLAPRRRTGRRNIDSVIKAAVKHGVTVRIDDVTITPKGNGVAHDEMPENLRDLI